GFRRLPQDLPDPALRDLQILIRRLGDVALPRDHGRRYRGYGPALAVDVDVTLPQIVERGLQVELVLRQRGVGITQDAQYALRLCGRVAELRCRPGHELPGDGGVDARPVRRGGLLLQILGADLAVSARGELLQSVEYGPPVVHGGLQGAQPQAVEFFHRQHVGRHVPQASADLGA